MSRICAVPPETYKNNIQVSNFDLILPFNQREKVS